MKTHLVFAIMTVALLALVITQNRESSFTFQHVIRQAQDAARKPFVPVSPVKSDALRNLTYDQYRDIRWKDEGTLWRNLGLPFQAKFFFTGALNSTPVTIYQVNRDSVRPIRSTPEMFNYGRLNSIPYEEQQKGGFSGFRIHYPINKPDYLDEVLVMLGASYFRSLAKDQVYGLSTRGIAIDTGSNVKKEEFPSFTTFWLVQPGNTDKTMMLYALLDGPSVTGAYQFTIQPGVETVIDVHAVLFLRKEIDLLGIAPLTSMYWYGENTSNTFGGWRPEVHDSDGLLVHGGNDEWIWRPLAWSKLLQINDFGTTNPRGFGLLQRDRDFAHYQDLEAHYHRRPSVWIEPQGDWGKGSVRLIQFPTNNEFMDNVVAFWHTDQTNAAGDRIELNYRMTWRGSDPSEGDLARSVATRIDYQEQEFYRVFVLDFAGEALGKLPAETQLQPEISIGGTGVIDKVSVQKNTNDNSWRVSFTASTNVLRKSHEIRCVLKNNGKPVAETWTYTWTPNEPR